MAECYLCVEEDNICNCSEAKKVSEKISKMLSYNLIKEEDFLKFLNKNSEKKYSIEKSFVKNIYIFLQDKSISRKYNCLIDLVKDCKSSLESL